MALIPPGYLDCVVSIGTKTKDEEDISWVGTGFLVGRFIRKLDDEKSSYLTFLVTNKHVLEDEKSIIIRFNPESGGGPAKEYRVTLVDDDGNQKWVGHPTKEIDVGVITINPRLLRSDASKFFYFKSEGDLLSIDQMVEKGVSEGDFIYVLGYPMGIVDPDRQYVIVRSGCIARIRGLLEKRTNDFVVDASVFPGNSGGPVIIKPELVCIAGTKQMNASYLIGIVSSYIPYSDVAISTQTKLPRVVFQENSGLGIVIPTDFIMETIESCIERQEIQLDTV